LKTPGFKPYFLDEGLGVSLYLADCLEFLDETASQNPGGIFDCIFADPPYFLSNGGITCKSGKMASVDKGNWDRTGGPERNHDFNREWLSRCRKVLKPHGTIWVTGTNHVIFSVGFAMQELGYKILNDITWEKPNPPPNLSCRYFTHSTETLIWAARSDKSRHRFNYGLMKEMNGGRQMKTVWSIKAPGRDEKAAGKHPTQKPVALVERCLLASTNEGDLVCDPFLGSGTTAVAAVRLRRRFVGMETDEGYLAIASERVRRQCNDVPVSRMPS
jgi:site-specific DNA-methyltransferase (adenine-specific)